MKAILTRIRRMEQRLVPAEETESQRIANVLWERRRRHCEATGEPFEEMPPVPTPFTPRKRLSVAETLRIRRLRAYEQNVRATGAGGVK